MPAGKSDAQVKIAGNISAVSRAVRGVIQELNIPPSKGVMDTPDRVAKSYGEMLSGYGVDVAAILSRQFDSDDDVTPYGGIVLLRDIEIYSLCEHHMLPFVGRAHVAYIPNGNRVVGISKLARVVDAFARRLQIQERLTAQIADALETELKAKGVAVIIEAEHFCIRMRGVGKQNSVMITEDMRGDFNSDSATAARFHSMIGK